MKMRQGRKRLLAFDGRTAQYRFSFLGSSKGLLKQAPDKRQGRRREKAEEIQTLENIFPIFLFIR